MVISLYSLTYSGTRVYMPLCLQANVTPQDAGLPESLCIETAMTAVAKQGGWRCVCASLAPPYEVLATIRYASQCVAD